MKRFTFYLLIATVIGGVFLFLTARELPWDEVGVWAESVDTAHMLKWSAIYIVLYAICHVFRIVRWSTLVRPLTEAPSATIHRVCAVGFSAILLLPFRLGEFVRPYLLARRTDDVGMSAALGTVVVERVVDGLVVTGLLFATLATYSGAQSPEFARTTGIISAAIFVPATVVCLAAILVREPTLKLLRTIGNAVSPKITEKLLGILEAFVGGFQALIEGRSIAQFSFVTAIYWLMNTVSMWVLAHYGFGFDLSLWDIATVLSIMVLGLMLPAGPAMAGNFEYFGLKALALFIPTAGVLGVQAAAFCALMHILQVFVITIPGFVVMWLDPESTNLIKLSEEAAAEEAATHEA